MPDKFDVTEELKKLYRDLKTKAIGAPEASIALNILMNIKQLETKS